MTRSPGLQRPENMNAAILRIPPLSIKLKRQEQSVHVKYVSTVTLHLVEAKQLSLKSEGKEKSKKQ